MASSLAFLPDLEPLRAVTVSRDVQEFDLLIEDMEAELGGAWGDLAFDEVAGFLQQEDAATLEFMVFALDARDADRVPQIGDLIRAAKRLDLHVILVADELGPGPLHELLRAGADDFTPYPLPEDALSDAIARLEPPSAAALPPEEPADLASAPGPAASSGEEAAPVAPEARAAGRETALAIPGQSLPAVTPTGGGEQNGAIFAIQSASGGDGATTLAVNLGWELANASKSAAPSVCLIDLGLQFGSVATYLDLPRKAMIYEVLSDIPAMDEQAFRQALGHFRERLHVFTAPPDILPLDLIGPEDVTGLLTLARSCFDIVIVDMPGTITSWTDAVFGLSDIYFVVCGMEVRSAQNAMRFHKLLQSEGLPMDRLAFLLNRGPGKMDMSGRGRVDTLAESLGVKFHAVLPDGGRQVTEVNDQAAPLSTMAPRNPLAKEVQKLAQGLFEARQAIHSGQSQPAGHKSERKSIFGLKFG